MTDDSVAVDLQAKSIRFSGDHDITPIPSSERCTSLRIADDPAPLAPCESLMIATQDGTFYAKATVESDQCLVLKRGVSIARGIQRMKQKRFPLIPKLLMNISK